MAAHRSIGLLVLGGALCFTIDRNFCLCYSAYGNSYFLVVPFMLPQMITPVNRENRCIILEGYFMDFGQRLKSLRLERGYTQKELSSAIGVSMVAIRSWEQNAKKPAMGCAAFSWTSI